MSKEVDNDEEEKTFAGRLRLAAKAIGVEPTQIGIANHLGKPYTKQKVDAWFEGSMPRVEKIFEIADKFNAEARWLVERKREKKADSPSGLEPDEEDLVERYRGSDKRWQLSIRLLAMISTEDQFEVAGDVNMVIARVSGMKPNRIRPVGNAIMRNQLKNSPQGFPPRDPVKKASK